MPHLDFLNKPGSKVRWGLLLGILFLLMGWLGSLRPAAGADDLPTLVNYSEANLVGKVLSGQDLRGGRFTAANLRQADLSHSQLQGSTFSKANLTEANLAEANLTGVMLDQTILAYTNLENANLTGAIFSRSSWLETRVNGADFTDAILDRATVRYLCETAEGVNPVTGVATRESLGCPRS